MKKFKEIIPSLLLLFMLFSFVAYNISKFSEDANTSTETKEKTTESTTKKEKYTIGSSFYNLGFEYFTTMKNGVLAKAEELGNDVIIHDQKENVEEMVSGSINLIEQGVDALLVSPVLPEAVPIIAARAKEEGIPLIVIDVGTGGANVDAFLVSDSFGGGVLAGEYALNLIKEHSLKSKNAAILKLEPTQLYAKLRGKGFNSVMTENGYTVVAEITANGIQAEGYEAMKEILKTYGDDLAVVFSENDRMALGAAQAIDEAGKKGQIMVIGFDGDPAAITAIKEGLMQGTIVQQVYEMGELSVEIANSLLSGETIIYDDPTTKELLIPVYLIDETGEIKEQIGSAVNRQNRYNR